MPTITVQLSKGRTHEQKTKLVQEFTEKAASILVCPVESIDVIFVEVEPSNWAHAGRFYGEPT